jgi:transposase-like protein
MSYSSTRGKKGEPHRDPGDTPRRRANKRRGHGTDATDRPPIFSVKGRASGHVRYFVRHTTDSQTCLAVVKAVVKPGARVLNTDEWRGYAQVETAVGLAHATVKHGKAGSAAREWARDDDGDGVREVHGNGCEGAGTALRTYLRAFRGVPKKYLDRYVATFETMANAKQFTSCILRRMCLIQRATQSKET